MFVSKLACIFTRLFGEGKRAAISKSTYIWSPSSRSYIVFALISLALFTARFYKCDSRGSKTNNEFLVRSESECLLEVGSLISNYHFKVGRSRLSI